MDGLSSSSIIWFKFNKVYTSVAKGLNTKSQKVLGANFNVFKSYRGKTCREGDFLAPSILNRVNACFKFHMCITYLV